MAQITLNSTGVASNGALVLQSNGTTTAVTIDTSQRAAFVAGTAALPAITTTGDTNTGIFFPAADTIAFSEGGVEAARIDASGNLGLGVTPSAWAGGFKAIQVAGSASAAFSGDTASTHVTTNTFFDGTDWKYLTTTFATDYFQYLGQHVWRNAPSGTAGNAITFTQAMTLDASGNLGIGTTSPAQRLDVNSGAGNAAIRIDTTSNANSVSLLLATANSTRASISIASSTSDLVIKSEDAGGRNNGIQFWTGNASAERARFDSSGNLLVGTTSAGTDKVRFSSNGATTNQLGLVSADDTSGNGYIQFRNSAATSIGSITRVTTTNAVAYNTTSDYRLKTVTGAVSGQGARIDALKPVDYLWKEGNQQARGFLAHEFQTVYPNSVTGDKDAVDADGNPKYQAMQAATSEVIADLVSEIQSLRKRLAAAGI